MSAIARSVVVHGRVQGVGFRWFVLERAEARGVAGWVRNRRDGSVEALLEGETQALSALLDDLRRGPPLARVDGFFVHEREPQGLSAFDVRPTA